MPVLGLEQSGKSAVLDDCSHPQLTCCATECASVPGPEWSGGEGVEVMLTLVDDDRVVDVQDLVMPVAPSGACWFRERSGWAAGGLGEYYYSQITTVC